MRTNSMVANVFSDVPTEWTVDSITINSRPARRGEFRKLVVGQQSLRFEPAGIEFRIRDCDGEYLTLTSRTQSFTATCHSDGSRLQLDLMRPDFGEQVTIRATNRR